MIYNCISAFTVFNIWAKKFLIIWNHEWHLNCINLHCGYWYVFIVIMSGLLAVVTSFLTILHSHLAMILWLSLLSSWPSLVLSGMGQSPRNTYTNSYSNTNTLYAKIISLTLLLWFQDFALIKSTQYQSLWFLLWGLWWPAVHTHSQGN